MMVDSAAAILTSDIQQIMHALGDVKSPLLQSAQLIESIVHQQMKCILQMACDVALQRGSKFIGLEEIVFLMRKNKVKLQRLIKFAKFRDSKSALAAHAPDESIANEELESPGSSKQPIKVIRVKVITDFLESIDHTGYLSEIINDEELDEVSKERQVRANQMSLQMSVERYYQWAEARSVSFGRKLRGVRFRDWLVRELQLDLKLNAMALEFMHYLAYETVADIVDMCFLVKRDRETPSWDGILGAAAPVSINPEFPNVKVYQSGSSTASQPSPSPSSSSPRQSPPQSPACSMSPSQNKAKLKKRKSDGSLVGCSNTYGAITPHDIREVIRRYFSQSPSPMAPFSRNYNRPIQRRLFIC